MNITEQLNQAKALITELQAKADAAATIQTALDTATAQLTDTQTQLATATDTITTHVATIETLTTSVSTLQGEVATLTAERQTANEIAQGIVASLGITTQPEVPPQADGSTRDQIIAKYVSLTGRAKGAYFAEHKAIILSNE